MIYTPKKTCNTKPLATETGKIAETETQTETQQRKLPNILALPIETMGERQSYYSSQPEIVADSNTSMLAPLPPIKLQMSQSFTNIRTAAALSPIKLLPLAINRSYDDLSRITNIRTHATTASPKLYAQPPNFPILKICPSTPSPSESDSSQVSPKSASNLEKKYTSLSNTSSVISLDSPRTSTTLTPHKSYDSFSKIDVNMAKVNSCSRPSFSLTTSSDYSNTPNHHNLNKHKTNISKSSLLAASSPLFCNKHHRSLNELNASAAAAAAAGNVIPPTCGTTDSPSMKRFTSPASAAIVAAGSSGNVMGSRTKLTPSPSKTGISSTTNAATTTTTTNTSSTNSSAAQSENSPISTATTVIPKEVGEICRRSSDSDLSVTPKGKLNKSLCPCLIRPNLKIESTPETRFILLL